jgi:hypothetical protein
MAIGLKKAAIAASTAACVGLMSFSCCEQRISLGVAGAQAREGASRPPSVVGARKYHRRSVYRHGLFEDAVAATTSPWIYDDYYCYGGPYRGSGYPPGRHYFRSYSGGYCVRGSSITGLYARPTLFPRYYVD